MEKKKFALAPGSVGGGGAVCEQRCGEIEFLFFRCIIALRTSGETGAVRFAATRSRQHTEIKNFGRTENKKKSNKIERQMQRGALSVERPPER